MPAIRGLTVGPIENVLHPQRGYGSERCESAMLGARNWGANWVSITPFGRIFDLSPTRVSLDYEASFKQNKQAVTQAIQHAHAAGLRVMLVPHLWVETGGWRGEIELESDEAWESWAQAYLEFVRPWATLAADTGVEMLVSGVELRSWVTTHRAPSFLKVLAGIRQVYPGLVTYAANWDDVEDTVILGELDLIGVNAFFPLATRAGAGPKELLERGQRVAKRMQGIAERWDRPVVFTEFGYTTRRDPALEPWLWPEHLANVVVDQQAQADAYWALLAPLIDQPWFAGAFMWRVFSDPYDSTQEAEWGFSPQGKLAENVLSRAFQAHWAADGLPDFAEALFTPPTSP
jgi:hypothetical protein